MKAKNTNNRKMNTFEEKTNKELKSIYSELLDNGKPIPMTLIKEMDYRGLRKTVKRTVTTADFDEIFGL